MKYVVAFFSVMFLFFVTIASVRAQETTNSERIERFVADIKVDTDGSIRVQERISYNFGSDARHGIYRTIPTIKTNTEGKKYRLDFVVSSITDEKGAKYTYEEEKKGDTLNIKIGDPDRTITGIQQYHIVYTVRGALTYFSDHDELYWNITGNEWNIPIVEASARISLPTAISAEKIRATCYSGVSGSTSQECEISIEGNIVSVQTARTLGMGEGLTAVIGFPTGIVSIVEPEEVREFFSTFLGKLTIVAGIIALIIWYVLVPLWLPIKWWLHGRDPQGKTGPLEAWFEPPKTATGRPLTPAETGALIDEHAAIREISALLVHLAQRGYLKIVEKEKKQYELVKIKEFKDDSTLLGFEKKLLQKLFFSADTLELKGAQIASDVEKVQHMIYEDLVKEGYFPENPDKVRQKYMALSVAAGLTFNFFLLITASIFGRLMPRKTIEGVEATHIAKSLKNFLTSQERQLKFQAKNQMMFEKLLPFAIAFGVERIWSERFKEISIKPPEWFESNYAGVFTTQAFARSLGASMAAVKSAATPVSSSTGHSSGFSGGSSGGGGGGGGGGSW